MRKAILAALALVIWCGATVGAEARPKFVGNCLSDDGVRKLFQTYGDIEQLGPWSSEAVRGRKKNVYMPDISTGAGTPMQTLMVRTKQRIKLAGIPAGKTVVATVCGSAAGGVEKVAAAASADDKGFYPNGKPSEWRRYGKPRRGAANADAWFESYSTRRGGSITFVNLEGTARSGYVWAYVRPSDKND